MADEPRNPALSRIRGYHWAPGMEDLPSNQELSAIPLPQSSSATRSVTNADMGTWALILPYPNTEQGRRCLSLAEQALGTFIEKNNIYGEPDEEDLGSRGQFADMHRKWKRIRRHMWDGEPWPNEGESFEEVCFDFIGHLLLTMDFKRRNQ